MAFENSRGERAERLRIRTLVISQPRTQHAQLTPYASPEHCGTLITRADLCPCTSGLHLLLQTVVLDLSNDEGVESFIKHSLDKTRLVQQVASSKWCIDRAKGGLSKFMSLYSETLCSLTTTVFQDLRDD